MIHNILASAIAAWVELCGVSPDADRWSSFGEYDKQKTYKRINAGLESDFSGLTSLMTLRQLYQTAIKANEFTYEQVLNDEHLDELSRCKRLRDVIYCPEANGYVTAFMESLREMVDFYKLPKSAHKILKDESIVSDIRFCAHDANKVLEELRFLIGKPGDGPIKIYKHVLEVWNTASLVRLSGNTPEDFIALAMVRHEDWLTESYFCIVCKFGQNVTIWTDRADYAHPLQHTMRRNSRHAEERMSKYCFPYELLDVEFSDKGRVAKVKSRTGIAPIQREFILHKEVKDLDPLCSLWLLVLFDLIVARVKSQEYRTTALCYVGESVVTPSLLGMNNAIVKLDEYPPLALPVIDPTHLASAACGQQYEDQVRASDDAWLVEKYGSDLKPSDLVILQTPKLLADKATDEEELEGTRFLSRDRKKHRELLARSSLAGLSPVSMGTPEAILRDVEFLARHNQITHVNNRAAIDFEKQIHRVAAWVTEHIGWNTQTIIKAAAYGHVYEFGVWRQNDYDPNVWGFHSSRVDSDFMRTVSAKHGGYQFKRYSKRSRGVGDDVKMHHVIQSFGVTTESDDWFPVTQCCIDHDRRASVFCVIHPCSADGLSWLCGVEQDELPEPLRHWTTEEPYTGNSLLNRIDPIHWHLVNPWRQYLPSVVVPFSLTGYRKARAMIGQPPRTIDQPKRK